MATASYFSMYTSSGPITGDSDFNFMISSESSSYLHKVVFKLGTYTKTINKVKGGVDTSFIPPLTWLNAIPNATSKAGTVSLTTYKSDYTTQVGATQTKTINFLVPSDIKPSVSVALSESIDGIADQFGAFVQGRSKIAVKVTGTGAYSSTVKSYKTSINGVNYTSANFTTGLAVGDSNSDYISKVCSTTITDSRGRTATKTSYYKVITYTKPKINGFNVYRCNADGTINEDSTNVKIVSSASVNPCYDGTGYKNTKSFKLSYKKTTDKTWTDITTYDSKYDFTDERILNGFSVDESYNFKIEATDFFETIPKVFTLDSSDSILDFLADGTGMAIGKSAELSNTLDIGYPTTNMSQYLHMGGNQRSDVEKSIYFYNTQEGRYPHKAKIYGGNGESEVAIGCYDTKRDKRVWAYYDSDGNEKFVVDGDTKFLHGSKEVATIDTKWQDAVLTSDFKNYNDLEAQRPRYKKQGNIVSIMGCVSPKNAMEGSSTGPAIFTLPEGYRPSGMDRHFICQGSGSNKWLLSVGTDGVVGFSRYGTNEFVTCPTSAWLTFDVTFMI